MRQSTQRIERDEDRPLYHHEQVPALADFQQICYMVGVGAVVMRQIMDDPAEEFPAFYIGKRRFAFISDIEAWLRRKAERGIARHG